MTIEQFIQALADAPTYDEARAVVDRLLPAFSRLPPDSRNQFRKAWNDRQAELADIGEVKPHLRGKPQ